MSPSGSPSTVPPMLCCLPGDTSGEKYQHRGPATLGQEGFLPDSIGSMCPNHVYKRRRLRNSVAPLSDNNGTGGTNRSIASDSGMNLESISLGRWNDAVDRIPAAPLSITTSMQSHPQKCSDVPASQPDDTRDLLPLSDHIEEKPLLESESPMNGVHKQALGYNSVNDSSSLSKSKMEHCSPFTKAKVEDAGECSFSDIQPMQPSVPLPSAKDLCVYVIGNCHQLREQPPSSACNSFDLLGGNNAGFFMSCKVCGLKDSSLEMLICDLCDEAFHLTCCKVKKLPVDEWYCQLCLRKKPKVLPETLSGQLFYIMHEKKKKRMLREKLGPILSMLQDTGPYTSSVRIGKNHQAEVPEWTGPISGDDDYFSKPSELDPADWNTLNGWSFDKSLRPNSIGNWLQCRHMIYNEKDENDEGVVCGKWRRAPLSVSQTDDWDCSCAVVWDPIHADCAVPQELETSEVLKHLKCVGMMKPRVPTGKRHLRE